MTDSISISVGGGKSGSTISKSQVAHGFTILDGIYHNGTIWVKAKADLAATVAIYCVSKIVNANNFEATNFGSITATAHGKTVGQNYFLDANVAGTPTITPPTSGFNSPLFYVESVDIIHMIVHRSLDLIVKADDIFITDGTSTAKGVLTYNTDSVELSATAAASNVKLLATNDVILDPTGDIDASDNRIKNLADPTSAQHAATKKYVDDEVGAISNPNILINGGFQIAQRGNNGSNGGEYILDRWYWNRGGASSWGRLTASFPLPHGASNGLYLDSQSGTDSCSFQQSLEKDTVYSLRYKEITLSFKLKRTFQSDQSMTFRIYEGDTADTLAPSGETVLGQITITSSEISASVWNTFSLTVIVPSNSQHISVRGLVNGDGSYIGFTQLYVAQVKLEVGGIATPYIIESYGDSLIKCQRYTYAFSQTSKHLAFGNGLNSTKFHGAFNFPTVMRINPTGSRFSGTPGGFRLTEGINDFPATAITFTHTVSSSTTVGIINITVLTGLIQYRMYRLESTGSISRLIWDAEIY